MSKFFTEQGFLSEEGKVLVASFRDQLMALYATMAVADMSEQELHILQANLASMVGEMSSWTIQARKDVDKVIDPWVAQLKNK